MENIKHTVKWIKVTKTSKLPLKGLYWTCSRKKKDIKMTIVSIFCNPSEEQSFRKRYCFFAEIVIPEAPKEHNYYTTHN